MPSHSGEQDRIAIYAQNPESSGVFRKLVFLKNGVTFPELIGQIDIEKRAGAYRRLNAVHRDYSRVLIGAELKDLKFSWDHFDLLTQGLDFGLETLTPDELAGLP